MVSDAFFNSQRKSIFEYALRNRMATIFSQREYVEAGGLLSYGEPLGGFFHRAASFVDKVFKGHKPADLPVEQPTTFEFVINLRTAKALGVKVPNSVLLRTDRVIE